MRAFIFVTFLAVTLGRPEAPYTYNGLAQQQQLGLLPNAHMAQPHVHQQLPVEHSFSSFAGTPPMTSYIPPASHNSPQNSVSQPSLYNAAAAPVYNQYQAEDSYTMAHLLSSIPHDTSASSAGYPYAPQQTSIHKHVYVHVPPKDFEDEAVQPRVHHQVAPKQKHYKIVFIKAPSAPMLRAPVVAPPQQNEEKTLIYVLHKKPEDAQDIIIPTPAPTKPSKPEVFFIKYKTRKEEAPVYGPPSTPGYLEMEPRHGAPSMEYGAPIAAAAPDAEEYQADNNVELSAPLTTLMPSPEEQHPPQFVNELPPAEVYSAPTMASYANEEPQPTVPVPSNQYLGPQPIVAAEEQQLPATNYGPPGRFFLKKN